MSRAPMYGRCKYCDEKHVVYAEDQYEADHDATENCNCEGATRARNFEAVYERLDVVRNDKGIPKEGKDVIDFICVVIAYAAILIACLLCFMQSARAVEISKDTLEVVTTMNAKEEAAEEIEEEGLTTTFIGEYTLTHYCACAKCTNGSGVTASGTVPVEGRTCAAEGLPIGTKLLIAETGEILTVEDRFGDPSKTNCIDIYVADHEDAVRCGVFQSEVYILNFE